MLAVLRPHPPRADGERDGELLGDHRESELDPIQLASLVSTPFSARYSARVAERGGQNEGRQELLCESDFIVLPPIVLPFLFWRKGSKSLTIEWLILNCVETTETSGMGSKPITCNSVWSAKWNARPQNRDPRSRAAAILEFDRHE